MKGLTLFVWIVIFVACTSTEKSPETLKKETTALGNNLQDFVVRNTKDAFDHMYPIYNPEVADTKYNKERFEETLSIPVTKDVSNIYAYFNQSEEEPVYLFSFTCNQTTADKIITNKKLILSSEKVDLPLMPNFDWWNTTELKNAEKYTSKNTEFTEVFWYNNQTNTAYYSNFVH